ncbi:MAG: hypothetical protein SFY69_07605 [Planctomycetota bacterium]|nr:hypothetical protein [Planctomycetota bacterium]
MTIAPPRRVAQGLSFARSLGVLLWRSRWGFVRLGLAGFVLWVVAADLSARVARRALAELPDFDYAAEVRALRLEGRYGEAVSIADAGLRRVEGEERDALLAEKQATLDEQSSWLRRAKDVGWGALSGEGETLESLVGAVAADFFVVGDVRDIVIQGGRYVVEGETDEVILALSVVGVATTLAPQVDWAPSILKAARRIGALGDELGGFIVRGVRRGEMSSLRPLLEDSATIARRASPGGAARLMRHADSPEDVARLARFIDSADDAHAALHIGGKAGADLLRQGANAGPQGEALARRALLRAAPKGRRGVEFVTHGAGRALLKPHPLVGLAKALYKGNAEDLITRTMDALDRHAWWMLPAAASWVLFECGLIALRWRAIRRRALAACAVADADPARAAA